MTFRGPLYAVNYSSWFSYVLDSRNGWQQRNPYTLQGQDTFYGAQGQSPPGSYATPPPIDWRNGYTASLVTLTLKGQDTFYDAPGQSPPGSYATPPPIDWRNGFTLSLVNSSLNRPVGKSTAPPRHEVDWRNGYTFSYLQTLKGQDTFYGAPGQSPPGSYATPPPIDWRNGWLQSTILLYPPPPVQPFSARSFATPFPIDWRGGFTSGTTALRLPAPVRPPGKQSFVTPFPVDWRNGFVSGTTALTYGVFPPGDQSFATPFPIDWRNGWVQILTTLYLSPPPLSPPGALRQLRDRWDRDEWGTFIPGSAIRDAIGAKQTQEFVTKPWKVDN